MAELYATGSRQWQPTRWPGVEASATGDHVHSGASLFRMRAGARISWHNHPHGEHTYIVEGEAMFGEVHAHAGDVVYTPPDEGHEVRALTDVVFLGVAPREF